MLSKVCICGVYLWNRNIIQFSQITISKCSKKHWYNSVLTANSTLSQMQFGHIKAYVYERSLTLFVSPWACVRHGMYCAYRSLRATQLLYALKRVNSHCVWVCVCVWHECVCGAKHKIIIIIINLYLRFLAVNVEVLAQPSVDSCTDIVT